MRYLFLLILLLPLLGSAQNLSCGSFRNGKYTTDGKSFGRLDIDRNGKQQIEYSHDSQMKMLFKVRWVDSCTYQLKLVKLLENPKHYPINKSTWLTVKILEIGKDYYIQQTTSKKMDFKYTSEMRRME